MLEGVGVDRLFASQTIGKYISGQALTSAEALIVQQAKALLGSPPAGDLPIITAPGTPPPTGGTGGTPTSKPPGAVTNLHVHKRNANKSVTISWNSASGAVKYAVYRNGARINIVGTTSATVGPPAAGTYTVKAINSKGQYGPSSNALRL
jgi:hypothetical protein